MEMTFIKTTSENLNQVPVVDGQFIVASDTSQRFLDFDSVREGIASQDEIDAITDVYGSKNLLDYHDLNTQTIGQLSLTVNDDRSIYANGSSSSTLVLGMESDLYLDPGTYILSDGGYSTQFSGHVYIQLMVYGGDKLADTHSGEAEFTISSSSIRLALELVISHDQQVDGTFYPMIRDSRIKDSTYVPYARTNRQLSDYIDNIAGAITSVYSSKNLAVNTADKQIIPVSSVTFTVNSNGSITYTSPSALSSDVSFVIGRTSLKKGTYIASKVPDATTVGASNVQMSLYNVSTSTSIVVSENDSETFTLTSDAIVSYGVKCKANSGAINTTIYPMIRLASITDATYEPRALTNTELTQPKTATYSAKTNFIIQANSSKRIGKVCTVDITIQKTAEPTGSGWITIAELTDLESYPVSEVRLLHVNGDTAGLLASARLTTNGDLMVLASNLSNVTYHVFTGTYVCI